MTPKTCSLSLIALSVALALAVPGATAQSPQVDPAVVNASVEAIRAEIDRRIRLGKGPAREQSVLQPDGPLSKLTSGQLLEGALTKHGREVIYGVDDRKDFHEITDPAVKQTALASTALFNDDDFEMILTGVKSIKVRSFAEAYRLCPGERYAEHNIGPFCSGTLIAPNLVLTAGHCVGETAKADRIPNASRIRFVFGFRVEQQGALGPDAMGDRNIYAGKRLVAGELAQDGRDWAIVELERPVDPSVGVPIKTIRKEPVRAGMAVYVIGYPSGLPMKYAPGANVRDNSNPHHFTANLDTYGGNSGSGVYEQGTNALVGVLVRGETDYVTDEQNQCRRSNICPTTGCRGEDVQRASTVRFPR